MKPIILIQNVVLERILERSLTSKEIKPVNCKGNQPWIFIGRTDAEAEAPTLWPPDTKSPLVGKDPGSGKDWRQKERRATENEMVEWHHQLSVHEFEQTLGDGEGQGGLACCSSWGYKETQLKNWTANPNSASILYSIIKHFPTVVLLCCILPLESLVLCWIILHLWFMDIIWSEQTSSINDLIDWCISILFSSPHSYYIILLFLYVIIKCDAVSDESNCKQHDQVGKHTMFITWKN